MLASWVGRCCRLCISVTIKNWICDKYAQPVGLGEKWPWSICCYELQVVACKSMTVKHGQKLSIEVEAEPVPQKTTFSHKNHAESVRWVKRRQQEGTGHNKGNCHRTKKGESSRLPKNELMTGTLGHRHQPQYQPYRIRADTGGEILGEEHKGEADEQRSPQQGRVVGS